MPLCDSMADGDASSTFSDSSTDSHPLQGPFRGSGTFSYSSADSHTLQGPFRGSGTFSDTSTDSSHTAHGTYYRRGSGTFSYSSADSHPLQGPFGGSGTCSDTSADNSHTAQGTHPGYRGSGTFSGSKDGQPRRGASPPGDAEREVGDTAIESNVELFGVQLESLSQGGWLRQHYSPQQTSIDSSLSRLASLSACSDDWSEG
ncbi:hypothetical protein BaRGS_00033342, partial [Batillaria attramentaria]